MVPPNPNPSPNQAGPVDQTKPDGSTALMYAAQGGHLGAMIKLVEHGADISHVLAKGDTVLMQACMLGHLECARWLLDQGSDVNQAKPDGTTAVLLAACVNRSDLIGFLHTRGADLSSQIGPFKQTYLSIACHHEAVEAVQTLLDLGADPALIRISQNETTSCLDFAATRGSIRLMTVLLGHPAYPVEHRTQALLMLLDPELDRVDHLHAFLEHPSEQSVRTIDKPDVRAAFCNPPQKPATSTPTRSDTLAEPCRKRWVGTATGSRFPPSRARARAETCRGYSYYPPTAQIAAPSIRGGRRPRTSWNPRCRLQSSVAC